MIECPHCKEFVQMIDDSGLVTDKYTVYLECPECQYRLIGDIEITELEHLPPME